MVEGLVKFLSTFDTKLFQQPKLFSARSNHIRHPHPSPLGEKVFGVARHHLPAVNARAGLDQGVG